MNFICGITEDGWISFIGSILGFIGVIITIVHTKKQFEKDKRISVKPYLDVKLKYSSESLYSLGIYTINKMANINLYDEDNIGLEITNLGQGNCLNCKLIEVRLNNKKISDECMYIGNMKADESILRGLTFVTWYGDILEEIKKKCMGKPREECTDQSEDDIYRYPVNKIEMKFEYKDVLDNKYSKTIVIDVFIIFKIHTEGSPYFEVKNINFESVTYEINGNMTTEELIK